MHPVARTEGLSSGPRRMEGPGLPSESSESFWILPQLVRLLRVLHTFEDVVWHVSWSVSGNILAVSGGDNKVVWRLTFFLFLHFNCLQVSLWKETLDEQWQCISDVSKGASNAQG